MARGFASRLFPKNASANLHFLPQAYELSVLTGTQVLLLVVSETGLVYTFTTPKLQPLVTKAEGKNLIQVRNYPHAFASHSIHLPFAFWLARCFVFRPDPLCDLSRQACAWAARCYVAACESSAYRQGIACFYARTIGSSC